jgi:hypothetical protein
MNTREIYELLDAARAVVAGEPLSVERLDVAIKCHDRTIRSALEHAHRWVTWDSKAPTQAHPPSRIGSLTYVPTDAHTSSPLLYACAAARMTESQVIEMQRRQCEDLMKQLMLRADIDQRRAKYEIDYPQMAERARKAEELVEFWKNQHREAVDVAGKAQRELVEAKNQSS